LGESRFYSSLSNEKGENMKHIAILLIAIITSGCTFMHKDFANYGKNYDKVKFHMLTIGDDKQQVINKIGEPVNVIGSKKFEKGIVEVWSYEKWRAQMGFDTKEEEYWVYFLNGKLEQWGRPGDWSKEADIIYEIRYR